MGEAMNPGLSVEECVRRLKRFHYAFKRLHEIFTARITSEPIYELKMGFSLHAHLCAEHTDALRKRIGEMREPPLGLEVVPNANLKVFFDEILAAPSTEELLLGLYEKAVPALTAALEQHQRHTNKLVDQPSIRLCRFALLELGDLLEFGRKSIASLVSAEQRVVSHDWLALLDQCLASAGTLAGTGSIAAETVEPLHSAQPFQYDRVPRRDHRFPDPYNMGVNAEVFL